MELKEALIQARDLVAAGWTQGACARDAKGRKVSRNDSQACEFCTYGAWLKVTDGVGLYSDGLKVLKKAVAPKYESISAWNDTSYRTQEEAVELFNKAIEVVQQGY